MGHNVGVSSNAAVAPVSTPYVEMDRAAWARLRDRHPLSLDAADLARIQGTGVPLDLIAASVRPVYQAEGYINVENLVMLQEFFGERDLLDFDGTIDPETVIEQSIIDDAVASLDS